MKQSPDAAIDAAFSEDVALAKGLAGLRQFLFQSPNAQMACLLLLASSFFWKARAEAGIDGRTVIVFQLEDEHGDNHECHCDPAAFALLMVVRILGQSVFINLTGKRPYLKVFGRAVSKAGIVFARLLLGAEQDEQVGYKNGDTLDLTFSNLVMSSGRAKRGTIDWYGLALGHAGGHPDRLFAGSPEQKFAAAKELLHLAVEHVQAASGEAAA